MNAAAALILTAHSKHRLRENHIILDCKNIDIYRQDLIPFDRQDFIDIGFNFIRRQKKEEYSLSKNIINPSKINCFITKHSLYFKLFIVRAKVDMDKRNILS